jgi:hypothetical protein
MTPPLLQQINLGFQNIFTDKNIKLLFNTSKHLMTMTVILIMVFFTVLKKQSGSGNNTLTLNSTSNSVNSSPIKIKDKKEDIKNSLNNLLFEKMCKNKSCLVCGKDFLVGILSKSSNFSRSQTIITDADEKPLLIQRRKTIGECMSPAQTSKKFESQKKNSDYHKYIKNVRKQINYC